MNALNEAPINANFLSPTSAIFKLRRSPSLNFYCQVSNLPGIGFATVPSQPNPFADLWKSGDQIMFNEFEITFAVDEDLQNYLEVWNWITGLGFPQDTKQYQKLAVQNQLSGFGLQADGSLIITTNGKLPNIEVVFWDLMPINLSDLVFDTTNANIEYITASVRFRYTLYEINPIK